jgi:hypothetical protein
MIDLIGGELVVHDLGFKPSMILTPTSATPQLRWLFLQENQEHK